VGYAGIACISPSVEIMMILKLCSVFRSYMVSVVKYE